MLIPDPYPERVGLPRKDPRTFACGDRVCLRGSGQGGTQVNGKRSWREEYKVR
jgi:hypothetical protein